MLTLALPVGQFHGWGVCGRWIIREMAALTDVQIYSDLQYLPEFCEPAEVAFFHRLAGREKPKHFDSTVFKAILGMEMMPWEPEITGNPTIGYCFFETDKMLPQWIETARRTYQAVLGGSSWCSDVLRSHGLENVGTLIQGVNEKIFHPIENQARLLKDRFVIFSGGKLELRKGQDLVLCAARVMQQRHKDVVLAAAWVNPFPWSARSICASPYLQAITPSEDSLQMIGQLMHANGLDMSRVLILKPATSPQMAAIYRQTDIGLFPNRCEGGTNLVLMEYMACGKPAIASWTSGHRDILTDSNSMILKNQQPMHVEIASGVIANWDDSNLDEIVDKLEWAYQNREGIKTIGNAAGVDLAKRTWSRTARELATFLKI